MVLMDDENAGEKQRNVQRKADREGDQRPVGILNDGTVSIGPL
jgi:hypothetical protein